MAALVRQTALPLPGALRVMREAGFMEGVDLDAGFAAFQELVHERVFDAHDQPVVAAAPSASARAAVAEEDLRAASLASSSQTACTPKGTRRGS
jgi:hypothetical protein